ncbi:MAG TPA: PP2C family protein-serine/threonine phosphatase [Terriglobales bacterium]|jgi:sigma-B regulation protein RsbU (phosphoserine phosphatase)|nr:PP2C family protein-serine/threonine phosphatase [Terriglobales bacterium]
MTPSPSQAAAPPPQPHQGVIGNVKQFWHRVTEGLELSQLWKQFSTDARASYRLYQKDYQARAPQEKVKRGFWRTAQEFAWAILEKLTPARRVLLLLGVVLLLLPAGGYSHRTEEGQVEFVEFDLRFLGGASLFILLMLEIADRVVMKRDLEIARDIQHWLLPATPPQVPGLTMAFATRPANTVAGDYYDAFARPRSGGEPLFLFAVADVAGKSIPAALLMATFQAGLKTLSATPSSLAELVAGMNRYASSNSQDGRRFTTAFLAEYDSQIRTLTYINAGHNAPILRHASGGIERLTNGGLPLGIMSDAPYESGTVSLQPGDWLVIFTDGVVEALNAKGEEYEESRLLNVLQNGTTATPDELLRRLMADLDFFVGTTPQHDDVTCMLVKVS